MRRSTREGGDGMEEGRECMTEREMNRVGVL